MATGGGGVDVDHHARRPAQRHHLGHGLEGADLVVGPLAVDQGGSGPARRTQAVAHGARVDPPGAVDPDLLDRHGTRRGVAHGGVLDGGAQDGCPRGGPSGAPHGGVDGLGGARGEHDLAPGHVEQFGHLAACGLQGGAHRAALLVHPSGVTRGHGQPLRARGDRLGPRRGGAGVIEVGARHRGSGRGGAGVVAPGPRGEDHGQGLLRRRAAQAGQQPRRPCRDRRHRAPGWWCWRCRRGTARPPPRSASPRSSACAAKPSAVRVSATTCMAARTVRCPSAGVMREASERP